MNPKKKHITVFEHDSIRVDRGDRRITPSQLETLQRYYGESGVPYFSLIHKGIKFNEYVGVIQVGNCTIEVLPKADKSNDAESWREVLIGMLNAVGIFDIHVPTSSHLQLKSNSILDLYFELFVKEVEYLLRRGLVKKYRVNEGNNTALKGSIQFPGHIRENLIHQERFYVRYTTYDKEHQIHCILYKALKLLHTINTNSSLSSRIGALLLDFPEMKKIRVTESLFDRIQLDRKTEVYSNSLEIARLILLNYHPDISHGNNDVLALMFDMNVLWEQFVYVSLRKYKPTEMSIAAQNSKSFWKPSKGNRSKMRPDIVINKDKKDCVVLDTKWKNLKGYNPSPEDLRQMYVYMKYYTAIKVALIYPGGTTQIQGGAYYDDKGKPTIEECSVISLSVDTDIRRWQQEIYKDVIRWAGVNSEYSTIIK